MGKPSTLKRRASFSCIVASIFNSTIPQNTTSATFTSWSNVSAISSQMGANRLQWPHHYPSNWIRKSHWSINLYEPSSWTFGHHQLIKVIIRKCDNIFPSITGSIYTTQNRWKTQEQNKQSTNCENRKSVIYPNTYSCEYYTTCEKMILVRRAVQ